MQTWNLLISAYIFTFFGHSLQVIGLSLFNLPVNHILYSWQLPLRTIIPATAGSTVPRPTLIEARSRSRTVSQSSTRKRSLYIHANSSSSSVTRMESGELKKTPSDAREASKFPSPKSSPSESSSSPVMIPGRSPTCLLRS